jgi:hypothetical protein
MESAAVLIESQPCDVFIACLVLRVSPGAGDNWVGSHEWWWLHWVVAGIHVATSFLSFCWGMGGKRKEVGTDHILVPAPEPTPRAEPLRGARAWTRATMAGTP